MLRIAQSSSVRAAPVARRQLSSKGASPLEADYGPLATHVYHKATFFQAFAVPLYFMVPDRWTDGTMNKAFGLLLAATISFHSWMGMNYVCTDYVPKISKQLLGPARIFNAGLGAVTLLGLGRIALSDPGIKGCIKGLWNPPPKKEE
jgi:succinate dehydrogenase hydrophobic anchor subunit